MKGVETCGSTGASECELGGGAEDRAWTLLHRNGDPQKAVEGAHRVPRGPESRRVSPCAGGGVSSWREGWVRVEGLRGPRQQGRKPQAMISSPRPPGRAHGVFTTGRAGQFPGMLPTRGTDTLCVCCASQSLSLCVRFQEQNRAPQLGRAGSLTAESGGFLP